MRKPIAPGTDAREEKPEYLDWKISPDKKKKEEKWKKFFKEKEKEEQKTPPNYYDRRTN